MQSWIGKSVLYFPAGSTPTTQPFAAFITSVLPTGYVELAVFNADGSTMTPPPGPTPFIWSLRSGVIPTTAFCTEPEGSFRQ